MLISKEGEIIAPLERVFFLLSPSREGGGGGAIRIPKIGEQTWWTVGGCLRLTFLLLYLNEILSYKNHQYPLKHHLCSLKQHLNKSIFH
jgi:hypothetical protein